MEIEIFIENAGLVILNAYLPYFYEQLNYLDDQGNFKPESAKRAALVLQYVYDPGNVPIHQDLSLNKILCGLDTDEVLPTEFVTTQTEEEMSQQMISAIISHWKMVSNSSPEGFRESWLQREGKLTKQEQQWDLIVEKRAFDILLDYKPFSLSPIKFSWMAIPIQVQWR